MTYMYFIGVDMGKASFEVARHDKPRLTKTFANTPSGITRFLKAYSDILPQALVICEATGGYENALLSRLQAGNMAVHRAAPLKSCHFMRSLRLHVKTDAIDATALARYGFERHDTLPLLLPLDDDQNQLQALVTRRADLIAMRMAEQQRFQHPVYALTKTSVEKMLATINECIDTIEAQMKELIANAPRLQAKMNICTGVKGIGETTAMTLIALMPELGTMSRRQAASLAGCAPHPRDSGASSGYRSTRGGRQGVKKALFMAAMVASRFHPELHEFYERLVAKGKKKMVALTAVMRKIIVILNAKLRDHAREQAA